MLHARSEERPNKPSDRPEQQAVPKKMVDTHHASKSKETKTAHAFFFFAQVGTLDWAISKLSLSEPSQRHPAKLKAALFLAQAHMMMAAKSP